MGKSKKFILLRVVRVKFKEDILLIVYSVFVIILKCFCVECVLVGKVWDFVVGFFVFKFFLV